MVHHDIVLAIANSQQGLNHESGPPGVVDVAETSCAGQRNNYEGPALGLHKSLTMVENPGSVLPMRVGRQRFGISDDARCVGVLIGRIFDHMINEPLNQQLVVGASG